MKYGKAALLMGIALLVPSQLCWADDASLNSAVSDAPQAIRSANVASSTSNSLTEPSAGSSGQALASAPDSATNTPSTGGSEVGAAGSGSQPSRPTYVRGWNQTEDGWAYLTSDAQDSFCEGWLKLGDTWYWLDPTTHLMVTGVAECNGYAYRFLDSGAMATGWSYDSEASLWYYSFSSGELAQGWVFDRGAWYWLDPETRAMRTGWLEEGGTRYWLDASGAMATGWRMVDGSWYAFSGSGAMRSGWLCDGGAWYWLDPQTGAMATGVLEVGGAPYCFRANGAMATGWALSDGSWCYASGSGALASGWLCDRGAWYWLDPETRAMRTGWLEEGGTRYWLDASGAMATGWRMVDGSWYAFSGSGAMRSGWLCDGGAWYWLDPQTGAMATGVLEVGGVEYYFDNASGAMASNGWVVADDGQAFYAGSSGAILCKGVQSADGIIATGEDGLPFAGWIELDDNRFLFSDEGLMLTGWQELDGTWYYLNDQGIMQTGWLYWSGHWYLLGNSGAMQTGWNYVDGNWYYLNSWGAMACGGWQYVGSVDYKFSSSGAMVGAWVDVPCCMQYPELPTGCESVALTNLLNYYGFGLSKTTIAGHYLPLSQSNNFVTAFAGDPFTGTGGLNGCVAPAIVIAGNNYLNAVGSSLRAVDVSFSSIPALKNRLSCGQPIEVWNTEWGGYPGGRYAASWYNGHSYGLWGGNHAVVLKGYDDEEGIVYVSDSISGDVTRDARVFFSTWQMMDSQAVAIE